MEGSPLSRRRDDGDVKTERATKQVKTVVLIQRQQQQQQQALRTALDTRGVVLGWPGGPVPFLKIASPPQWTLGPLVGGH